VVAIARPVAAAVAVLVHILLIVAAVLAGVAAVTLVAYVAWRVRRSRHESRPAPAALPPGVARAAQPLPAPQQRAIEGGGQLHLHFHGVTAEDVADIIERNRQEL
jgi:hypothetical protein